MASTQDIAPVDPAYLDENVKSRRDFGYTITRWGAMREIARRVEQRSI